MQATTKSNGLTKIRRKTEDILRRMRDYIVRAVFVSPTQKNYIRVIEKLKNKRPLHVLFLIHERAQWGAQSLYDAMEKDPMFTVQILVVPSRQTNEIEIDYQFFKQRKMNVVCGMNTETRKMISLKNLCPDIVIYPKPSKWSRYGKEYTPSSVSQYALTCYIPYGFMALATQQRQYNKNFHLTLWRYFCETPIHLDIAQKYMDNKGVNVMVSGYPKMDPFFIAANEINDSFWKLSKQEHPNVKRLVWAPHWTVAGGYPTAFSTFLEYHKKMLEYVKTHQNIEVVLKPHPVLRTKCVKSGLVSQSEIDDFFSTWNDLPNGSVVEDGNYIDLFKSSDAMILDSISFISEYMYTGKPLLFLRKSKENLTPCFNEYGQEAIKQLYEAHSWEDIEHFIDDVVIQGNDPLYEQRVRFVNDVLKWTSKPACENIIEHLKGALQ